MLSKAKIKYIQTLGHKKHRDAEGVFIAEGPKLVSELFRSISGKVKEVYATKEWLSENQQLILHAEVNEISGPELEKISQFQSPQQVLAVVQKLDNGNPPQIKGRITLALDAIQDPGNMGTIVRIADWFGIGLILCSHECADIYNPKVVQATMGSIARVVVMYDDLEKWLPAQKGIKVYAATLDGQDLTTMQKISEGILLVGNESKGIRPALLQAANEKITIPQKGKAESLNAAVATGIILSHIC